MQSPREYYADVQKIKTLRDVLGANVRALRKAKRLSQPKVAAQAKRAGLEIDQTTVSRIERGIFPATLDSIEAIAAGLDEQPWRLLIPEVMDHRLLAIIAAWSHADDSARAVLYRVADAMEAKEPTEQEDGGETKRSVDTGAHRR